MDECKLTRLRKEALLARKMMIDTESALIDLKKRKTALEINLLQKLLASAYGGIFI